eukprot:bmy_00425T0
MGLSRNSSCGISGVITIVVLLAIDFGVYILFLSDGQDSPPPYSEYTPHSHHYQRFTNSAGAPPVGFKAEFTGQHGATSGFGSACMDSKEMNIQDQGSGLAWELEEY